jgi:putative Holliday junction resolvase
MNNKMRKLGIDYGDSRVGLAITDELEITAQGLETIHHNGNDKLVLKRLDEILAQYSIDTFVIGMPINMDGTKTERVQVTEKFIHKLKCKFPKISIATIDERLTTVAAHKTMNYLNIDKNKKKQIVDTISAVYILETYMNKQKNNV